MRREKKTGERRKKGEKEKRKREKRENGREREGTVFKPALKVDYMAFN